MASAPLIDLQTIINAQVASTSGLTDDLILVAADSCGLLGTAQSAVNEIAASAANAADAAINKTIESVGKVTKKVNDFAEAAQAKLEQTVAAINAKIQALFDDAQDDPTKQSALDNFLARIASITAAIESAFTDVLNFAQNALGKVSDFVNNIITTVLEIANDARIMACGGANAALSAVGSGIGGIFDSMAESLSEGKSPQDIIKERNSAQVKTKSDAGKAEADAINIQADNISAGVDTVDANLDQLQAIAAE